MTRATKTHHDRAVCPICFAGQVVRIEWWAGGGKTFPCMVDHGYTVTWGDGRGHRASCRGFGLPHFGTPEGREIARKNALAIRKMEAESREHAAKILAGTADVYRKVFKGYENRKAVYVTEKIENPQTPEPLGAPPTP